jgi:hypothetical protein
MTEAVCHRSLWYSDPPPQLLLFQKPVLKHIQKMLWEAVPRWSPPSMSRGLLDQETESNEEVCLKTFLSGFGVLEEKQICSPTPAEEAPPPMLPSATEERMKLLRASSLLR